MSLGLGPILGLQESPPHGIHRRAKPACNTSPRGDHLRALQIIAKSGFAGLRRALDNGQVLPAVALPIFGIAFEASDSET